MILSLLLSHVTCLLLAIISAILLEFVIGTLGYGVLVERGVIFDLLMRFEVFHVGDLGAGERVEEFQRGTAILLVNYNCLNRFLNRIRLVSLLLEVVALVLVLVPS